MLTNQKCSFLEEDTSIATLSIVFNLNEQSFTFQVMSIVVINERYIYLRKKNLCRLDVMRCRGKIC